jgi:hypothetical protein
MCFVEAVALLEPKTAASAAAVDVVRKDRRLRRDMAALLLWLKPVEKKVLWVSDFLVRRKF